MFDSPLILCAKTSILCDLLIYSFLAFCRKFYIIINIEMLAVYRFGGLISTDTEMLFSVCRFLLFQIQR